MIESDGSGSSSSSSSSSGSRCLLLLLQTAIETASVVDDETLMCDLLSVLIRRPYVTDVVSSSSSCLLCLHDCLSVCLSVRPSVRPSVRLSVDPLTGRRATCKHCQ